MEFVTVLSFLLFCFLLLRALHISTFPKAVPAFFCVATASIVGAGMILSALNRLADMRYWALLSSVAAAACFAATTRHNPLRLSVPLDRLQLALAAWKRWYTREISLFERLLLTPLLACVLLLGGINLVEVVWTHPHNTDSMTYHLARVAYYLQHGNTGFFDANYWAQVIHPKNSSLLVLFAYLASGRNENLTQAVQFLSYWVAVVCVYGIARQIGMSRAQGLFGAGAAALLTEWLMQATTTQNDMLLTATLGCAVYFLFRFRRGQQRKYLALAALAIGLGVGMKATAFLALLPLAGVAVYLTFSGAAGLRARLANLAFLGGRVLVFCLIFALPSGYLDNLLRFGHPVGPASVRQAHSFEGQPFSYILRNGTINLLRYGFDFLSLDGLPPGEPAEALQSGLRWLPREMVRLSGAGLESSEASRAPFTLARNPVAHEDFSYWGVFGFGLAWIVVALAGLGVIRSPDVRALAVAALLFFIVQAYAGPYDPYRGRYFAACAVFALPTVGAALASRRRLVRVYLGLLVAAGCLTGVSAVLFRKNTALIVLDHQHIPSFLSQTRLEQLTSNRPSFFEPLNAFETLVPPDAVVALYLHANAYEYPLFGERLTRTLLPINPFDKELQPVPPEAGYLLYVNQDFPCPLPDDTPLGQNWYLRKLSPDNRACFQ